MGAFCLACPAINLERSSHCKMFKDLTLYQKSFGLVLLLGFIFKYSYLCIFIYSVPTLTGLSIKILLLAAFTILYVFPLLHNKRARMSLLGLFLAFTFFCLANIWYNRYFGNYLSLSDMMLGQGFRPFKVLVRQLLRPQDLLLFIDVLALIYLYSKESLNLGLKGVLASYHSIRRARNIVLIIVLLLLQIIGTNFILGNERPGHLYNQSTSSFVNVYGILPLYIFELCSIHQPFREQDSAQPSTEERRLSRRKMIDGDLEFENIIVIQVESLDQKIIGHEHNSQEVTPFLNDLRERSLYFENFYAQHVNGSFDAEFSFLTSIYPINKNYSFQVNDLSRFSSLIQILKAKGYYSLALHGNEQDYFHRHLAFPELGFDRFYSKQDFSFQKAVMQAKKTKFGINDYDFFLQGVDFLQEAKEPFFAYLITVTSHTPFDFYPPDYAQDKFQEVQDPLVRDYFRSISFVDHSLQMFFQELKERGLYEDTLLIVYSDHHSGVEGHEYSAQRGFEMEKSLKPPENIPLFIYHPDLEPKVVSKEGTPTDLGPTILDLLGQEVKPGEFFGCSLLSKESCEVFFLHETPQILHQGQLFALLPTGLEKIGHARKSGSKEAQLPQEQEIQDRIEHVRNLLLERRREQY